MYEIIIIKQNKNANLVDSRLESYLILENQAISYLLASYSGYNVVVSHLVHFSSPSSGVAYLSV